ncbi:MAG: 1,6-anhydro-N-acetylmuramyl-L-alanine amidase AmpD [Zoogloeaceae bacterium]|jgi:AmpD protein|nr:1,6-anhydro-N-acetylmuramyl-L-alanine amidase AmpD [Zoogloeaceae bacterium]
MAPKPTLSADGWLSGVRIAHSPNQDERPAGEDIRLLVIHAISLPPGRFGGDDVERFFANRLDPAGHPYYRGIHDLKVSAHFFIRRTGEMVQFVPVTHRAWHSGVSNWRGRERCNDFSIGIELEGCDERSFTGRQYVRLARLIRLLQRRFPIEDIAGHADIAPGRKTDPGPQFDWQRLRDLLSR